MGTLIRKKKWVIITQKNITKIPKYLDHNAGNLNVKISHLLPMVVLVLERDHVLGNI